MTTPLRVLFVEDSDDDVALLLRELRHGGYAPDHARVQSAAEFRAALARDWQIVISDYTLPGFGGMEALDLLAESGRDLPFILISGTVGEEIAVESMRTGANDYLLKSNLTRLVPAVARELREAEGRGQRRAAEAALRESQSLLSLIYNHSSDALWLYTIGPDDVGRLASANTTAVRQARGLGFSVSEADLLGRTVEDIFHELYRCPPEQLTAVRAQFDETARTAKSSTCEQAFDLPGGRLFLELTLVPVADAGSACQHILAAGRDVTGRKQAEDEQRRLHAKLAQAQKLEALGTLAGGIAHDFNNILTAVLGYADLIQRDTLADAPTQARIEAILTAATRAQDLVRQILTFSRKQAPARKPLRLAALIHETLKILRANAPASVTLQTDVRDPDLTVLADAGQMHQVILNLGANAIQALGPAGGLVTMTLDRVQVDTDFAKAHAPLMPGPHARLSVHDTGRGIEAGTLEHIFEPFFTTKAPGQGTGLGLAVVHGIIQSHQGAVTVESQPGRGTTFHVWLAAIADPANSGDNRPVAPPHGHGELVLFVDDEPSVVRLGEQLLERLGYRAEGFTDPSAALSALSAQPGRYAVVVTDLSMPVLSGMQLAQRIRALAPNMPVILMSGFLHPTSDDPTTEFATHGFLGKPFTLQSLGDALAAALRPG